MEVVQVSILAQLFCQSLFDQEKRLLAEIDKWSIIEEQVRKQKSRTYWISCGDTNSKYFRAQWKIRISKKTISYVYTDTQIKLTDPIQMEATGECILVMPCPNSELTKKEPCVSLEHKFSMIQEVTKEEIDATIQDMPETNLQELMAIQ